VALIRQESIDAVLDACDMLEVVAPYTSIRKSGSTYKGKCPFHSEKTPSFTVDPVRKLYHCFGCGEGGNVFRFLEEKEGLGFADAVKWLADKYGVRLEYEESSPRQEEQRRRRERACSLLDQAASFYTRVLWESSRAAAALSYLHRRGFDDETIRTFRLGYSPAAGDELVRKAQAKGYGREELLHAGLASERGGRLRDRFRGRLMFPFTDHRGRVLGFGARVLDDSKPKYLNSPDSGLYHKSDLVFGLGTARQASTSQDRVYIVEGYTDVLALHQAGITNAVASMGTALTESQLKEVSRFTANVYLAFDADAAGRKAMMRALELSRRLAIDVRLVRMPSGSDPAELIFSPGGKERFLELADGAQALLEYQVQAVLGNADLESAEGRVKAFEALKPILANAVNAVERDEQLRLIADRLRLSPENVAYLMESGPSPGGSAEKGGTRRRVLSRDEITERSFLSVCLAQTGEAGRYLQDMTEAHFTTAANRSAFNWVRDRIGVIQSGSVPDMASLPPDDPAQEVLPELIIRSETEPCSPEALPELFLRLTAAEIGRRIDSLKKGMGEEDGDAGGFRELASLEEKRRRILEHLQSGEFNRS
jgi:DNA primase